MDPLPLKGENKTKQKKGEDCSALSSYPAPKSKKYTLSKFTGQLVRGGSPRGKGEPQGPLTCIAVCGPSIGRAGGLHQPRCSPHWHLSGEGAVSQNPPPEPSVSQTAAQPPACTPTLAMPLPPAPSEQSGAARCLHHHCLRQTSVMFPRPHFLSPLTPFTGLISSSLHHEQQRQYKEKERKKIGSRFLF